MVKNEQSQNKRGEYQIDEITYGKEKEGEGGRGYCLKLKLRTGQTWTLINNFVIALIHAKCSKLITLKENIISSEVLNSGIKKNSCRSCFSKCSL